MRKVITIFLIIFIIFIFSYIIIRYFGNTSKTDNWFNNNFREKLVRYPIMRTFFNLHWDGDAKTDYSSSNKFTSLRW